MIPHSITQSNLLIWETSWDWETPWEGVLRWSIVDIHLVQMMCGQRGGLVGDAVSAVLAQTPEQKLAEVERQFSEFKRFMSGVTHDMGSALHCTLGFMHVALLATAKGDTARAMEYLTQATRSGEWLKDITTNLLDQTKYETNGVVLDISEWNIGQTISKVLSKIEYLRREKNITVKFLNTCNVVFAYDENKMARVIQNIVGNAIKFCSYGDHIEVTASNTAGSIFISIADTGEGIPSMEIDSIFERYTQTERSRKKNQWVGLWLSICKDIIEAHGGSIWATNNDTKWANFRIRLSINL